MKLFSWLFFSSLFCGPSIEAAQKKQQEKRLAKHPDQVKVGTMVLRCNAGARKGGPLEPDCMGPYKVVQRSGNLCQLEQNAKVLVQKYSVDHLKLYLQQVPEAEKATESVAVPSLAPASISNHCQKQTKLESLQQPPVSKFDMKD